MSSFSSCWLFLGFFCCFACSSEPSSSGGPAVGASGASGTAASGSAGVSLGGSAGSIATAGAAGASAGTAGASGAMGGATAGGSAGMSAGGGGGGGASNVMDPGTDGDGDFVISPPYTSDPLNQTMAGVPQGNQIYFQMDSADSTIYPGRNGPYTRDVWLYVPQQYQEGTAAPLIVVQDGYFAVWFGNDVPHDPTPDQPNLPGTANLPRILDNLIDAGSLPNIVALFVTSGGGDGGNSQRGLEYDTVSGVYAEFVETEVIPRAIAEAETQLGITLTITSDPQGRATLGGSSGGAGSFSMAWWHPDLFARVISYSGTFVRQIQPEDPLYPHGCWSYHDFDPFDVNTPDGLIMQEAEMKPIRVWLEVGENDLGAGGGPDSYRDFPLANERMAMSLAAKGYHYHYDFAEGAGHLDGNVVAQTLPSALLWLWRGYPIQ